MENTQESTNCPNCSTERTRSDSQANHIEVLQKENNRNLAKLSELTSLLEKVEKALKECQEVLSSRHFICDGEEDYNDDEVIEADKKAEKALLNISKFRENNAK